jgi:hypothetical protein
VDVSRRGARRGIVITRDGSNELGIDKYDVPGKWCDHFEGSIAKDSKLTPSLEEVRCTGWSTFMKIRMSNFSSEQTFA